MKASEQAICPKCGKPLQSDAPGGLCPRCLIGLNLHTETVLTGEEEGQGDVAARPPLNPEEIAPHFPQLDVLECLGRGGMGVVYKARQRSLGRLVALKLLAPEREKDPEFAARFAREAKALAQLSHPHIVTIYDFGEVNGFFYLLMEFVDGVNLRELLRLQRLSPEEALAIVPSLCDALQFAHDRGIVHRDIKPENLLLAKDGGVKIADFGIAKMMGPGMDQPKETGTAGTPGYMAPEQVTSPEKVDSRADIYSLGVCFYEMLTGEKPTGPIQLPSRKVQVDVRIDDIVLRALERTPEMRYQTAAEFRTAVETVASSAFPTRTEDQRAGAEETPPDRSWMRVLGFVLLVPGIPLGIFGLVMLWMVLHDRSWHPSPPEAIVTMGSWATAALLLGGSVVLLRLSGGKKSHHSSIHSAELPPLKPWQQSWLAEPLQRRQTIFWTLLFLTLGLFTVFAWPSYHVTGAPGAQIAVSGFGFPEPWLQEIRTYGAAGMQNWPEYRMTNPSFLAGVIGLVCWILLASLHATEMRALPASRRNSWVNIVLTLLLCLGALAHAGLLSCAIIPAPPFMTVALAVAFGAPALLRVTFAKASSANPAAAPAEVPQESASHSVVFGIAIFILAVVALFLILTGFHFLGRQTSPQLPAPAPIAVQAPLAVPLEVSSDHGVRHIETEQEGVYFDAPGGVVYFALYHRGGFDPARSRTRTEQPPDRMWRIEGNVTTKGGRFFNFQTAATESEILTANGEKYDLRRGRVLLLNDEGQVKQLPLFPRTLSLESLPTLAGDISALTEE